MIHGVVSVIIPTAGRPTLDKALESLRETSFRYPMQVIVEVDADNDTYLDTCDYHYSSEYYSVYVYSSRGRGALAAWNWGLNYSDGEYIVMGADDLVFHESWLTEALKALTEQTGGIGCVGFNDLHNGARAQTHFLMHRSFIVNHLGGVLCPPVYHHFKVDSEIIARARLAGLYAYAEKAIVQHDHWANGRRPYDKWDQSIAHWMREDEALYVEREKMGFPNNYEAVIRE